MASQTRTCKFAYPCICTHTYTVYLSSDDDEKKIYTTVYQRILKFIPGLKKFLLINRDSDPAKLYKLIEGVSRSHVSHYRTENYHTDTEGMQQRPLRHVQACQPVH